jgi:hypothetical protein
VVVPATDALPAPPVVPVPPVAPPPPAPATLLPEPAAPALACWLELGGLSEHARLSVTTPHVEIKSPNSARGTKDYVSEMTLVDRRKIRTNRGKIR